MTVLDVSSIEVRALLRICEQVSSPVAYKASCLIARGDWDGYLQIPVDPAKYTSAERYLEDSQVVSLLRKHPSLDVRIDRRQKAIDSFFKAESLCYVTNERLNPLLTDLRHYGERMHGFLRAWRKEVKRVVGRAPLIEELEPRHGPGSTYNNVGDLITVADKFDSNFTATRQGWALVSRSFDETSWSRHAACGLETAFGEQSAGYLREAHSSNHPFAIRDVEFVRENKFTTVPKTALTDRGICIEPSVNVFYQLALGGWLSKRLKWTLGWDKSTCQEYHRRLARLGSLTGAVATIDLSMASDTVCSNLVKLLLPRDWFDLLDQLRSRRTSIDGKTHLIEKFSSMGNGFTFELETLIFFTLARVITREHVDTIDWFTPGVDVTVFGDDIIVPTQVAEDLISALRFFGFTTNKDKTFVDGPFRESCGGDFYRGSDVRPHFQKKDVDAPERLIAFSNGLNRVRNRLNGCCGNGSRLSTAITTIQNQIPRGIRRCRGPAVLGDLVLTDEDPTRWTVTVRGSIRYLRVWRPVPNARKNMEHYRPGVQVAVALYLAGSEVSVGQLGTDEDVWRRSGIIPRVRGSYVSGYRFGRVPYS